MKIKIIFFFLAGALFIPGCSSPPDDQNILIGSGGIADCEEDYECLYQQISEGNSARIIITEEVESLFLIEESEIKVEPVNNKYKVTMKVLDVKQARETKSIVDSLLDTCPQIKDNLDAIKFKEAICTANSAEEARQLAANGLNEGLIMQYGCAGDLIDAIRNICVTPEFPNFPPGVKKPAIYLYPEEKSEIEVSVKVNGFITKSEPDYFSGWRVTAEPTGLIAGKFDYLFYEAQLKKLDLPEEGWIVKYSDLENWFDQKLPLLGLNQKELSQFKEYWLKELKASNYYEIKILDQEFLSENLDLIVNPAPDTMIRLNFYFKPRLEKIYLEEPIIATSARNGFTVIEWGGLLDD